MMAKRFKRDIHFIKGIVSEEDQLRFRLTVLEKDLDKIYDRFR